MVGNDVAAWGQCPEDILSEVSLLLCCNTLAGQTFGPRRCIRLSRFLLLLLSTQHPFFPHILQYTVSSHCSRLRSCTFRELHFISQHGPRLDTRAALSIFHANMSSLTTSRVSLSPRKSYTEKPVPPVVQQALTLRPFATKDARRDLSTAHRAFVGAWDGLERCLVLSQSCRRLAERAAEVLLGVHEALNAVEQAQKGERVQVTKAYEFEAPENALTVFKIQS